MSSIETGAKSGNLDSIGAIEYQKVCMDESVATAPHHVYNKFNQEYADCSLDEFNKAPSQNDADHAYGSN